VGGLSTNEREEVPTRRGHLASVHTVVVQQQAVSHTQRERNSRLDEKWVVVKKTSGETTRY